MSVLVLKTPTGSEQSSPLVLVSDHGVSQTHEVRLTPEHPVFVLDRSGLMLGWVTAGELVSGDMIADIDGGEAVKVVSNTLTQTQETVYNFEVKGAHNYFADELGLWVHNGRGSAFKHIFYDPNTPKWAKGMIKNWLRQGRTFSTMKTPTGCDLGHPLGKPARKGHKHGPDSRLETPRDNRGRGGRSRL